MHVKGNHIEYRIIIKSKIMLNLVTMIIKLEKESKYGVIQCQTYIHGVKKTTNAYKFCVNEWYNTWQQSLV